ncbi:MAG TPA: hypothetical protein VNH22_14420 [Blastocatellia bacterium]|jgi:hypothetical protein|nr:hypothetical protein [Blastocatellia bacterium]
MTSAEQGNSLFIVRSSKLIKELLTRGIAHAADSQQYFTQLTHRLISASEFAYSRQDFEGIKQASSLLVALPLPQAQSAGLWYQAISDYKAGKTAQAAATLDGLVNRPEAAPRFRARALQSLGTIHYWSGDAESARLLYMESARYIRGSAPLDAYTFAQALILHSYSRGLDGESRQAVKELLSLEKLVKTIGEPLLTATYCNNIAVELLELGHVNEAAFYSRVACLSPFVNAHTEWKDTALEIDQHSASKAVVAVAVSPEPRKRPAQPKYLLVVLRFSPCVRLAQPKRLRQRVSCKNPTSARVASVARIRAPSAASRLDPQQHCL